MTDASLEQRSGPDPRPLSRWEHWTTDCNVQPVVEFDSKAHAKWLEKWAPECRRRVRRALGVAVIRPCVNVYLPDDLAERAKAAGLSISALTQDALRSALAASDTNRWLDRLERLPSHEVPHGTVLGALDDVRDEFGA
jgi:post-segregation antitoxin (ccd killing protein)